MPMTTLPQGLRGITGRSSFNPHKPRCCLESALVNETPQAKLKPEPIFNKTTNVLCGRNATCRIFNVMQLQVSVQGALNGDSLLETPKNKPSRRNRQFAWMRINSNSLTCPGHDSIQSLIQTAPNRSNAKQRPKVAVPPLQWHSGVCPRKK